MAEKLDVVKERLSGLTDEELTKEFEEQAERVKTLDTDPSNTIKLQLYGLFKQAKEGDNETSQPGIFDPRGRAKWNAWAGEKDKQPRDAQSEYVVVVKRLFGEIEEEEE
ncbi:acyl-CoA-binding protein (ACBP)/diazepam binding inhibitor (DBI)/endozepine (EP) [Coemansia sp. RSA 1813]|nr:acyl-CoA-binding protein (ACBP)/diazepam binding inhibitor (DBI)/endozepine (EP) [Coemansia sp. RSA 1646]KAJ1773410.1 acyl-CoA-binding protein (ACBP)/diazepam binding inhibitor (DBI)/endozepine (EP) [Coemansia sp. RSA 1843]KAJ2091337.1 acyl-CoA-binding protein (ACBP)/diazepam binding inhibitor (DBI)/endozepine (EP) [Coemansia sp. RSA 986]KAJ2216528.1 acyl-CoA-binding protein (ACBP)/diazepam binding inhibitor (DBI)/endozepine (EP) [Coemansia sp. RSA 487]KAJ2571391.1 acyl-CoA-binding protein (